MAKELAAEVSLLKMKLAHKIESLDRAYQLMALARTTVPDEVKVKYLRDQGISTVQADVHVDALGDAQMRMKAAVQVKLTYKGDMVRSSSLTRGKINRRLQELAQKHCQERLFAPGGSVRLNGLPQPLVLTRDLTVGPSPRRIAVSALLEKG